MSKRQSLTRQVECALKEKLAIGESKHLAKQQGVADQYIYSWSTFKTYLKHCIYFTDYCKKERSCRTLDECKPYIAEWLATRAHLSAYTQKLELSALSKLYGEKLEIETKKRERATITRSRGTAKRDVNFSEQNNQTLIAFCRCSGLRRAEVSALRVEDVLYKGDDIYIDVHRATKGGRERLIRLYGNAEELELIKAQLKGKRPNEKVFARISSNSDIHAYRAEYCKRVYKAHERDLSTLPERELYRCRKDKHGVVYDRWAMSKASHALGHSRISVIAGHYL